MTASEKVQKLYDLMKDGYTIQLTHRNQVMYLTQNDVDKFKGTEMELLQAQGSHICIASGRRYDSLLGWTIKWGKQQAMYGLGHGGKRKGAGRKPTPYIKKAVKMAFKSEAEYREFLKLATPRERVEIILRKENK